MSCPVSTGLSAAERIRAQFDIPVIYVTAYADPDTVRRYNDLVLEAMALNRPVVATRTAMKSSFGLQPAFSPKRRRAASTLARSSGKLSGFVM